MRAVANVKTEVYRFSGADVTRRLNTLESDTGERRRKRHRACSLQGSQPLANARKGDKVCRANVLLKCL